MTFRVLDVDWCTSDKVTLASDDGCLRVLEMSMKSTCVRVDEQELTGMRCGEGALFRAGCSLRGESGFCSLSPCFPRSELMGLKLGCCSWRCWTLVIAGASHSPTPVSHMPSPAHVWVLFQKMREVCIHEKDSALGWAAASQRRVSCHGNPLPVESALSVNECWCLSYDSLKMKSWETEATWEVCPVASETREDKPGQVGGPAEALGV